MTVELWPQLVHASLEVREVTTTIQSFRVDLRGILSFIYVPEYFLANFFRYDSYFCILHGREYT
jgi:hypothetical protein